MPLAKSILSSLEKSANIRRIRGHSIWMSPLSKQSIIIDLGAHKGEFSKYFADLFSCSVFCVEANPELAKQIQVNAQVDNLAITSEATFIDFSISQNPEGSSIIQKLSDSWGTVQSIKVQGVPLGDYLKRNNINYISLLKSDIEGAELDIFESLDIQTLSLIDQMTIEFHDFIDSTQLPHVKRIIGKLKDCGFFCLNCNSPYHDDILFIRKKLLSNPRYWLSYMTLYTMKLVYTLRGLTHKLLHTLKFK